MYFMKRYELDDLVKKLNDMMAKYTIWDDGTVTIPDYKGKMYGNRLKDLDLHFEKVYMNDEMSYWVSKDMACLPSVCVVGGVKTIYSSDKISFNSKEVILSLVEEINKLVNTVCTPGEKHDVICQEGENCLCEISVSSFNDSILESEMYDLLKEMNICVCKSLSDNTLYLYTRHCGLGRIF